METNCDLHHASVFLDYGNHRLEGDTPVNRKLTGDQVCQDIVAGLNAPKTKDGNGQQESILTGAQFFCTLKFCFCARCVNFSCPLNRVPRAKVDVYLARNPVMREAWERNGYRLDLLSERDRDVDR